MAFGELTYKAPSVDLDPSLYHLDDDEKAFFQQLVGITDEEELKEHIIKVQAKAFKIFGYPCIQNFAFLKLKIARLPAYKHALTLLNERKDPILLDLGCCFGNDLRKAVCDGWPVEHVIASDLQQGFWDCGHELFKSTQDTFPAAFVGGDIFDPLVLAPRGAFIESMDIDISNSKPVPRLQELKSLTPLQGKLSAIHASAFFHLFSEEKQLELAHLVSSLLLPERGSIIFGSHVTMPTKGVRPEHTRKWNMFCHSPESWRNMWLEVFNGDGKGEARVEIEAKLVETPKDDWLTDGSRKWFMNWSVTRI
ncbi:hypothetical protein D9619_010435 [Psilocybe cf. subviscida]|uniref:Methyltransferase domain-containing protein n=1 Tax=Psilocybe cf. subviscida TaxID=2480587 RepID=A0A8H5ES19_9AGAR|nr:hypothetical protein D9619_010435 [Psilocybe cf. subviscida]